MKRPTKRDTKVRYEREQQRRRIEIAAKWAARHPARAKVERGLRKRTAAVAALPTNLPATPETAMHAKATHEGSLVQLLRNGTIDREQQEWAAEIANVHRSIEADVGLSVASLEARVDCGGSGRNRSAEGIRRVRLHHAYSLWRALLPTPKGLVLDMIVGDAVGYSVAAARHRVHKRRAKRELLAAIDRWPDCKSRAYREISGDRYVELRDALA